MGLNASLINFSPGTPIKSADMNSNLNALNNAGTFTGIFEALNGHTLSYIDMEAAGVANGQNTITVNHNLGVTPDIVIVQYAGNFGTPPTTIAVSYNYTSTQFTVRAQANYSFLALVIKF